MIPKVLFEICSCPNFNRAISSSDLRNPCFEVVGFQKRGQVISKTEFHIPEPWSGDIINAPILFISSNPGYANDECYPIASWPDHIKADYFINRFKDRGNGYSWVYKNRLLRKDGHQAKSVRYWSSIKKRAEELLGREAIPGKDYCNTELVHCKSSGQIGVNSALSECTSRFINEITNICGAKIIVGIGSFVKKNFKGIRSVGGIEVIYLPHPNAFELKTFAKLYSEVEIQRIRNLIMEPAMSRKSIECSNFDLPTDIEVIEFMESQFLS